MPIGGSESTSDILVMLDCGPASKPIIWMAGVVVERYESFPEFFDGMIAHNLEEVEDL